MGQPKSSLTDPPTDLKEAVDWIMWFGGHGNTNLGYGKHSELANAVDKLVSWSDLKLQLGIQVYISGLIKGLSDRVRDFLGYYSNTQFNNNGIAQHGYQSVYRDLQWSDGGDNLKECAKVFLAVASMVFYGLSFRI
ncbi:variant erythrocyte surface antigen-1 family protein [Babesia caballi]|uniref:Variant erythrocyte surface antigen-1 family protein n=1 Tax=Babesia caballi TaxID=5871 RepID=A0AAV4LYC2_BABCB|nr:variant erythrocyte surface antigen-1 family protein [Babesia caballi]